VHGWNIIMLLALVSANLAAQSIAATLKITSSHFASNDSKLKI
jgi:hypothetical protein